MNDDDGCCSTTEACPFLPNVHVLTSSQPGDHRALFILKLVTSLSQLALYIFLKVFNIYFFFHKAFHMYRCISLHKVFGCIENYWYFWTHRYRHVASLANVNTDYVTWHWSICDHALTEGTLTVVRQNRAAYNVLLTCYPRGYPVCFLFTTACTWDTCSQVCFTDRYFWNGAKLYL